MCLRMNACALPGPERALLLINHGKLKKFPLKKKKSETMINFWA